MLMATPSSMMNSMVKRCVIIQKDERGYGLRVSGDNPVFVESVRPDGAAYKAGVRAGDRIIKVNGTLVTAHGHGDVVKMIQDCGSYVGLTLLGLKNSTALTTPPATTHITGPQPASERTQQEYEASKVVMLQRMIQEEKNGLEEMRKSRNKNPQDIERIMIRIRSLEAAVEKITRSAQDVSRHRHASMSAENLTTNTFTDESTTSGAKKSHSFGQYDTRASIMTMESDEENEDAANNMNNNNSHRDMMDIPKHVEEIPLNSFRMTRYLLSQQRSPNALLFYTLAGYIFPSLVTAAHSRRLITKWAWQIECTWLLPESPLGFHEFPQEHLIALDSALESSNAPLEGVFSPFIALAREILQKQLEDWRSAAKIGLVPLQESTPKEELQEILYLLINERPLNINTTIDSLVQHASNLISQKNVSLGMIITRLAEISCLSTIAHYIFTCHTQTQHHLLSPADSSSPPPPNPVLRLSLDHSSGKKHKRHSSCPSQARSLNSSAYGITEAGHQFVSELTKIHYCSGCQLIIWGNFGYVCSHCQMHVHVWCLKQAALESPCTGPQESQPPPGIAVVPANVRGGKNRRWKSSSATRPLLDIIKKTTGIAQSHQEPYAPPLLSSTSSDDDDDDDITTEFIFNSQMAGMTNPVVSSTDGGLQGSSESPPTIQRSESFRQRRSSRPERSYRKRSDPALISNNTVSSQTGSTSALNRNNESSTAISDRFTSPNRGTGVTAANWASSSDEEDEHNENKTTPTAPNKVNENINLAIEETPPPLPPRNHPYAEKKKQILNELIETEERHVEGLRMLRDLFYKPMVNDGLLNSEQLNLVFLNSKKLMKVHKYILRKLREIEKRDVKPERVLIEIFCGPCGDRLEKEASHFCAKKKEGEETLRARKKDTRLKNFLDVETRTKELPGYDIARLSIEDHLGAIFQRPTKYPLLLQRLLSATSKDTLEYEMVNQAYIRSQEILSRINEAVALADSERRLTEILKKIDKGHGLTLDFKGHRLIHEGPLSWRIQPKQKSIDVWLVLTDKMVLMLIRDSDRFILKPYNSQQGKSTSVDPQYPLFPLDDLETRDDATDSTAFFLLLIGKGQQAKAAFLEFSASSPADQKKWRQNIDEAKTKKQSKTQLRDLTKTNEQNDLNKPTEAEKQELEDDKIKQENENQKEESQDIEASRNDLTNEHASSPQQRFEGVIRFVRDDECQPANLISPSRVIVSNEPIIDEALSVISHQQQIREIDSKMTALLEMKKQLLGQIQGISNQWEWNVVCDLASHDENNDNSKHEVSFLDGAMSIVTELAVNGLTPDARQPLLNLRDQIDSLLGKLSLDVISNETIADDDLSQSFLQSCSVQDEVTDNAAVYF